MPIDDPRRAISYRTAFATRLEFREATDRAREQLRAWLRGKNYDVERFDAGETGLTRGVVIRYAATNQVCGWQLREARDDVTWVSTLSVTGEGQTNQTWISLNVEPVVSGSRTPRAAPPRLVRFLLEAVDAYDDDAELRHRPMVVNSAGVDDLLEVVCAEKRRLPVVVAAAPGDVHFESWRKIIDKLVRYLPGLASMYLLDPVAAEGFNVGIGPTHWIGPGAVRTYLPGVDPAVTEDAVRHRVLTRRRIESEPARAARVLAVLPRQLASAALPPAAARGLTLSIRDSRRTSSEHDDQVSALRDEITILTELLTTADKTEQSLRTALSRKEEEILDLAADLQTVREDLERREANVRALRQRLVDAKLYEQAYTPAEEPRPLPTSFAELLDRVDQLDPYLSFTGDAGICLDLDEHLQSLAWAQAAWQGLLALADYAKASKKGEFSGDFKSWCESPPNMDRDAISAGKVARDESSTVRSNGKFHRARVFTVPSEVDPSGKIFMGAHIRLGNSTTVAPRMHFHDASRNNGAIYVGYIGPHLPNTLT